MQRNIDHAEISGEAAGSPPRVFRKLLWSERNQVLAHLLRLDPEDRRLRFMAALNDEAVGAYTAKLSAFRGIAAGCFVGGTLRGVAELTFAAPGRGSVAEAAVTVERPWQAEGIGTELMRRILGFARNRGITRVRLDCLPENLPMRHIVRQLGGKLRFHDGAVEAEIVQPWPDLRSVWREAVGDTQALLALWSRLPLAAEQPGPPARI